MVLFGYTVGLLTDILLFHAVHTAFIIAISFIVLLSAIKFLSTRR